MALSKVDLSKQIVLPQNVWISTFQHAIFSTRWFNFWLKDTNAREKLFSKCWLLIQINGEIQSKKNENLQDTGLDMEEVTYGRPTF